MSSAESALASRGATARWCRRNCRRRRPRRRLVWRRFRTVSSFCRPPESCARPWWSRVDLRDRGPGEPDRAGANGQEARWIQVRNGGPLDDAMCLGIDFDELLLVALTAGENPDASGSGSDQWRPVGPRIVRRAAAVTSQETDPLGFGRTRADDR